ncbi:helix-turn-helix domain-containing protein [Rhodococcus sp. P1Y]|uniref:helix-turn-helix domain-containing protein n=1 Tax=Rhodococcus sp. P1Y TaxID=1302308 RepID=UPI002E2639ED
MTKSDGTRSADGNVQSVDRAMRVLQVLARTGEAGVSAIAAEIGVQSNCLAAARVARGARDGDPGVRPRQVPAEPGNPAPCRCGPRASRGHRTRPRGV